MKDKTYLWTVKVGLSGTGWSSSVKQKFTGAHYTSLFHILPAPSTNSESSESRSSLKKKLYIGKIYVRRQLRQQQQMCVLLLFLYYIYTHTQTRVCTLHQNEMEHNRMSSAKRDRSVHEVARSTSIHIRHDILTAIKLHYLATLRSWINQLTLY